MLLLGVILGASLIYAILAKIVVKIIFKALDWESKQDIKMLGVQLEDYEHKKKMVVIYAVMGGIIFAGVIIWAYIKAVRGI